MPARATHVPLACRLALLILAGCSEARREAATTPVDTLHGVVTLEIGQAEGVDEYLFSSVIGPTMDSGGRILVPDYQLGEIRVYGPDGRYLFRVAGKGRGPGEVLGPCCLGWDAEGRLWVRDRGNGRYQAYRLDRDGATYERGLRFQHGDANFRAPLTFDAEGRLVDIGHAPGPEPMSVVLTRFHVTLDGTVVGTEPIPDPSPDSIDMEIVEREVSDRFTRMFVYQPFGSVALTTHGPAGAWATAASGYYAIRWIQPDGTPRILTRDLPGPRLTQADVRWAENELDANAEWLGTTVARLPFGIPDRKAPLQNLWFDQLGRLWVQLTTATRSEPSLAEIHDSSGTMVAVARWPRSVNLRFGYITDSVAVGVRRDSLDVPRVTVLRWE